MNASKYIHSCVLVTSGATKILLDPGKFSFLEGSGVTPEQFTGLTAVLITHQHPDHVDPDAVAAISKASPEAVVLANAEIRELLAKSGVTAELFESGSRQVGGCTVEAIAAEHAELLNARRPRNIAYVIDGAFLHPGDSFDHALDRLAGIAMLALPVMAPWCTELGVAEFARRVAPKKILPIHDGYAKDFFVKSRYDNFKKYFEPFGIEFLTPFQPGDGGIV